MNDILDPTNLLNEGLRQFDKLGSAGIKSRFQYALNNHSDVKLNEILKLASTHFQYLFL